MNKVNENKTAQTDRASSPRPALERRDVVIRECVSCSKCELSAFTSCPDCEASFCQGHYVGHIREAQEARGGEVSK